MKKQTFLFLVTLFTLVLTSCSVHKRHYNKGYHISWNKEKNTKNENTTPNTERSATAVIERSENNALQEIVEESNMQVEIVSPVSVDRSDELPESMDTDPFIEKVFTAAKQPVITKRKTSTDFQHSTFEGQNETEEKSGSPAVAFGVILLILGLVLLLFLSTLIGILIMILGAILLGVGAGKSKSNKAENTKEQLRDVLYLKNGSVIRGTIIEQIPNVSMKIQTSDGSIFVYKMEEIERITKEK